MRADYYGQLLRMILRAIRDQKYLRAYDMATGGFIVAEYELRDRWGAVWDACYALAMEDREKRRAQASPLLDRDR